MFHVSEGLSSMEIYVISRKEEVEENVSEGLSSMEIRE